MPKLTKLCLGSVIALGLAMPVYAAGANSGASATVSDTAPSTVNSTTGKAVTADTVLATVNGTQLTVGDLVALADQLPPQYKQLPPDTLFKGVLGQLVQQTLLQQSVEKSLTKKDQLEMANSKRAFMASIALKAVVKEAVTPAALKAAYDAKYANAKPGTEYHAAHILVPTEKEAQALEAKLKAGADFAKLAKANSKDGSAQHGGDLGWFGKGMMVKPFEDAVTKLKPGEISAPVHTQFGWHIIKLEGTRPAKKPTLQDVTPQLTKQLEQEAVAAKIKSLSDTAQISHSDTGVDPAIVTDTNLLNK